MQRISEISPTVQLPTGNKFKPTVSCTTVEVDQLLSDYSDLISPTFASWYAKCFYRLDAEKVHQLASQARADGREPAKLFSTLIKRSLR